VVDTGRKDWKVWLQVPAGDAESMVKSAEKMESYLADRTGGSFVGPTLVVKLPPIRESLFAGSHLVAAGKEVCITGIANPVQALGVACLPHLEPGGFQATEGPPSSRNPGFPQYIAYYVGRVNDAGESGVARLEQINSLYVANGIRTRILGASVRSHQELAQLTAAFAAAPGKALVDVTLPFDVLANVLEDAVTAKALAEFSDLE
jgi:transaldolase